MTYILLGNLYLAIFYTFYHFVLRKQTFFRLNRFFLLGSIVLAFTLPLAKVDTLGQYSQPVLQDMLQKTNTNEALNTIFFSPIDPTSHPNGHPTVKTDIKIQKSTINLLYLSGCLLAILMLLIRTKYTLIAFKNPGHKDAFSFFRFVCIGKDLQKHKEIVQHENVHIKEWHSLDIVIIQLLKIFNWFNPFVYALERSIKLQHEYYADQKASGIHQIDYAKLLLASAFEVSPHSFIHQFNHPPLLKSRIMMLLKNRTPKQKLIQLALIIPIIGGMIILSSACQSNQKENRHAESHQTVDLNTKSQVTDHVVGASVDTSDPRKYVLYSNVEITPIPHNDEYKSIDEFRKWISKNYTLPSKAIEANVSGLIEASFVIDESGDIVDVEIIKDLGHGTGEAFKTLLEKSLKWKPGIVNGQAVATKYTLPLRINAMKM